VQGFHIREIGQYLGAGMANALPFWNGAEIPIFAPGSLSERNSIPVLGHDLGTFTNRPLTLQPLGIVSCEIDESFQAYERQWLIQLTFSSDSNTNFYSKASPFLKLTFSHRV
jgi:hypothetical protein